MRLLLIAAYVLGYAVALQRIFVLFVNEFSDEGTMELDAMDVCFICFLSFILGLFWPIIGIGYLAYQYLLKDLVERINGGKN